MGHWLKYLPIFLVFTSIGCAAASLARAEIASRATGPEHSALCDTAARAAGRRHGVPEKVLLALNRTETGRMRAGRFEPWPWTVNLEGKGEWFDDYTTALQFAERSLKSGKRSFDVGCFQLNYRWHGEHFESIAQMFDPFANADYAARFLRDLYTEKKDWALAAAAYHSRTPKFADKYRTRFARILARLDSTTTADTQHRILTAAAGLPAQNTVKNNQFPLLHGLSDANASKGSLFPAGTHEPTPFVQNAGLLRP